MNPSTVLCGGDSVVLICGCVGWERVHQQAGAEVCHAQPGGEHGGGGQLYIFLSYFVLLIRKYLKALIEYKIIK